jgi:hypothetical protein
MDSITHILTSENILVYPGEFYLPTDCPVFLNVENYGLKKHSDNIFSLIFEDFGMPSYSNYPYPYQFDNDDEQFQVSSLIRKKVEEIKSKSPGDNYMVYSNFLNELRIEVCRDGCRSTHTLNSKEKDLYLSAVEKAQEIQKISEKSGIPLDTASNMLNDLEQKGLILLSSDRKSFLSLAMENKKETQSQQDR